MSSTVVARLQHWAVILSAYDYSIEHVKGRDNVVADCLSRVPELLSAEDESFLVHEIDEFSCDPCADMPISSDDIAKTTKEDSVLSTVCRYLRFGWPDKVTEELKPYYRIRDELSIECECIVWKNRVVIPPVFRRCLLQELHSEHMGISRMKAVARSFFWWPKLDHDIMLLSAECNVCQEKANVPLKDNSHEWVYPSQPFERIHIDFAEFEHHYYLLVVDAYSKWLEVFELGKNSTTSKTISCLLEVMSRFGIPRFVVSDNGPQFTSHEFASFCRVNGISHKKTPPYHPASNGQVERMVQELKRSLKSRGPISTSGHAVV